MRVDLDSAAKLSSGHAIRLYLFLESYHGLIGKSGSPGKNSWYALVSVNQLKKLYCLQDKYNQFADLKKRLILPPVDELNEKLDNRHISVEYIKSGKSVTHIKFIVSEIMKGWDFDDIKPVIILLPAPYRTDEIKNLITINKDRFLEIARLNNNKRAEPLKAEYINNIEYKKDFTELFTDATATLIDERKQADFLVDEISLLNIK